MTDKPPVRSAIILAAGRGSRLGGDEAGMSKALLDVGGETIIRYQVRRLRECGVDRLAVVTGFLAEAVRGHLAGEDIAWFHNEEFSTTNSCTRSCSRATTRSRGRSSSIRT